MLSDGLDPTDEAWHARPLALSRFVGDLVADEVARLRPGRFDLPALPWPLDLSLGQEGLGLDSLERLAIASALNEALHLHESGIEDLLLAGRRFGDWLEVATTGLRAFDASLTFRTSGSSGASKPCPHTLAALQQEATYLATLTAGTTRILSAVPSHHIYGFLFTILLPAQLKCGEVVDIRRITPPALGHLLGRGDLIISHPAHWELVARHAAPLTAGICGVTSTAPCPDALARALEVAGLTRLTQIYGSTETAGVGWRTAAGSPYHLMPFWSRDVADDRRLIRVEPDGTSSSYDPQDRLEWDEDGCFQVTGRLDDAVQVGGINVFPGHVRRVLLDHPQIVDAVVRLMAPDEGIRLKAFIVPVAGTDGPALIADLWRWTQTRLTAPERPKAFTLGDSLPVNQQGKPSDW